jgi:hypothetical protein
MDDFGSVRQPSDGASVVAVQIKNPEDQDGAKSEAGLLTICKPTRGEKMVKRAAPVRRIERTVPRAQGQCRPKRGPETWRGARGQRTGIAGALGRFFFKVLHQMKRHGRLSGWARTGRLSLTRVGKCGGTHSVRGYARGWVSERVYKQQCRRRFQPAAAFDGYLRPEKKPGG